MVRAQMLVDRLWHGGIITEDDDRGLLIVGGGATALTAAMHALSLDVVVTIAHTDAIYFGLQSNCSVRSIDPTAYDWPLPHWQDGKYPLRGDVAVPLPWSAGIASQVASEWNAAFSTAQYGPARRRLRRLALRGQPLRRAHIDTRDPDLIVIDHPSSPLRGQWTFGAVILCLGLGEEDTHCRSYAGLKFWEDDQLLDGPIWRLGRPPRILISGAGDGGLQDAVRALTGSPNTRQIFEDVMGPAMDDPRWQAIHAELISTEHHAQRVWAWSSSRLHRHGTDSGLHDTYAALVDDFMAGPLGNHVRARWRTLTLGRALEIKVAHRCSHVPWCYPLNRWLGLLADYCRRSDFGSAHGLFLPGVELYDVHAADMHRCDPANAALCAEHPHRVVVRPSTCAPDPGASPIELDGEFDVVVIRHGRLWSDDPTEARPETRQLLPLYPPPSA